MRGARLGCIGDLVFWYDVVLVRLGGCRDRWHRGHDVFAVRWDSNHQLENRRHRLSLKYCVCVDLFMGSRGKFSAGGAFFGASLMGITRGDPISNGGPSRIYVAT